MDGNATTETPFTATSDMYVDGTARERYLFGEKSNIFLAMNYAIASFGIPGNVLTILAFLTSSQLRIKPINLFLIHQSFIDLIACLLTIAEETLIRYARMASVPVICHLFLSKISSVMVLFTSTYNITFLTVERFLAITKPLQYDPSKVRRRLPFIFTFNWILCVSLLLFMPVSTIIKDGQCLVGFRMRGTILQDYYSPHVFTFGLMVPLVVMVICYSKMFLALKKSLKLSMSMETALSEKSRSVHASRLAQMNIFETCLLMTVMFVICWFTVMLAIFLYFIGYYPDLSNDLYTSGRLLILFNSSVNPYVYAIRYQDFKDRVKVFIGLFMKQKADPLD